MNRSGFLELDFLEGLKGNPWSVATLKAHDLQIGRRAGPSYPAIPLICPDYRNFRYFFPKVEKTALETFASLGHVFCHRQDKRRT